MRHAMVLVLLLACGKSDKVEKSDDKPKPVEKGGALDELERARKEVKGAMKEAQEATGKAEQAAGEAVKTANDAVKTAADATAAVDQIEKDLADVEVKVNAAVDAVANAQNEADRTAATAKLAALQAEKADISTRVAAAKAAAARAQRLKGVNIPKECIDNPLAKGCL